MDGRDGNALTGGFGFPNGVDRVNSSVMNLPLAGKSIIVVGGTSGLGLAAVQAFGAAGASVTLVGPDAESVEATVASFASPVRGLAGDARQPQTVERAVATAVESFGPVHGLYHVAGGSGRRFGDAPLHELTDAGWAATLELNATAAMYSLRAGVRQFLQQGTGGSILCLGSVLANFPAPAHFATVAYASAKAALEGLTRSSASFYARHGIRINMIAPGLVSTPMSVRAASDPMIMDYIKTKQPLDGGRIGRPDDCNAAAIFFMSDASAFCTGQILDIDGGWSLSEGQYPRE